MVLKIANGADCDYHSHPWSTHAGINFLGRTPHGSASSYSFISWMNTWRQALFIGNFLQQSSQAAAFIDVERSKKRILVLTLNFAYPFKDFDAILCQMERIQPAVVAIRLPLQKVSLLKIVQYRHEPAGMNLQSGRQLLLADAGRHPQQSQNSHIRWRKLKNDQSFRKSGSRMGSDLRQEKRRLIV